MNDSAKQQIIDRIKNSTTILVTVSRDPSVDELAAALALTAFLNKLKKHATAVVSGAIPPAINFLSPNKTFENTVDSLRDFIIELNKEKADHLRYKVEGEVVKIFITPYRTTITDEDLEFSQGDYNVELVLGIGVSSEAHLDAALAAHGRILHDATVATITAGDTTSSLGSIDWHDQKASGVSEMLVGLIDSLKDERASIDEPIATALMTGIVAMTERFSNNKTSSKVMTVAAQLMAAGANQQLIAANLEDGEPEKNDSSNGRNGGTDGNADGTTDMNEGESTKISSQQSSQQGGKSKRRKKKPNANNGELVISHEKRGDLDEISRLVAEENQAEAAQTAEDTLARQLQSTAPTAAPNETALPTVAELQSDIKAANDAIEASDEVPSDPAEGLPPLPPQPQAAPHLPAPTPAPAPAPAPAESPAKYDDAPMLGGTLNATTEEAAEAKRLEESKDRNKKILRHGEYLGTSAPAYDSPINSAGTSDEGSIDPFGARPANDAPRRAGVELPAEAPTARSQADVQPPESQPTPVQPATPDYFSGQTLADIDAANRTSQPQADDSSANARAEVEAAFGTMMDGMSFEEAPAPQFALAPEPAPQPQPQPQPFAPEPALEPMPAPAVPPLPDFSTLPSLPPQMPLEAPAPAGNPFTQMPPLPPVSAPQDQPQPAPETPTLQAPPAQAPSPTQFRIPGQ